MPCLNEAETLETCISKARSFFESRGIDGEVVVADNGSTDGSTEIAERLGARLVPVAERGYGSALRGGIEASRGEYVVMGDADDSYDFSDLSPFLERLDEGYDLVMGNRFRGGIRPGAMPWLHRWLGNPVLTAMGRWLFRSGVGDFHCGLRAFRRSAYDALDLRTTGMEFASEMVIKSALQGQKVTEVPTVLSPDGRSRPPHLRTWRDGWRHFRFMLLFSPRWLFLIPGLTMMLLGIAVTAILAFGSVRIGTVNFDIHTMFLAGVLTLVGYQVVIFGLFTKAFAVSEGFHPRPSYLSRSSEFVNLETGLTLGGVVALVGLAFIGVAFWGWKGTEFRDLDPVITMRQVIPGAVLLTLGVQTIYSSFFLSIISLRRRAPRDDGS